MNAVRITLTVLLTAWLGSACSYYARSADDYRKVTRELLETRSGEIKKCYKKVWKKDDDARGTVVVHFFVEEKTGKIVEPELRPESTAPEALGKCIIEAIDGLVLAPPDQRRGDATFTYEFKKGG